MDGLLREVVESLERKTEELEKKYPERERVLTQWKNFKMHQVASAKQFLSKQKVNLEGFDLNRELVSLED